MQQQIIFTTTIDATQHVLQKHIVLEISVSIAIQPVRNARMTNIINAQLAREFTSFTKMNVEKFARMDIMKIRAIIYARSVMRNAQFVMEA